MVPNSYYNFRKIPSKTSFQDTHSFCIDENKKMLLKNKKILLNLGEFSNHPPLPIPPPPLCIKTIKTSENILE